MGSSLAQPGPLSNGQGLRKSGARNVNDLQPLPKVKSQPVVASVRTDRDWRREPVARAGPVYRTVSPPQPILRLPQAG